jgi:hypothetical protein
MARSRSSDSPAPAGKAGRGPAARGRASGATAASAAPTGKGAAAGKGAGRGDAKADAKAAKGAATGRGRAKGEAKEGRIKRFTNQVKLLKQAFTMTRQNDPQLPWVMLIAFVVAAGVVELIAVLLGHPLLYLAVAVLLGLLAALVVFSRRAQGSAYRQVEGQPGAAAWVLEGMRGDWRVSAGVAGTRELDAVHRVLGRPGVVLVAEGSPSRVRGLLAQEKRRISRVVGDTPIYDITVGDDEGQVPLRKLSAHVMKLPRNLSPAELNSLGRRVDALGGARMPVPGGPLPGGRQMSVSQRQVRRR